jgi:DNA-binding GntR family transcriptional regulator
LLATDRGSTGQRDLAYDQLHRLLIFQRLRGGERLREPEWAARLGVNRTALREAFARLEAEGLVDKGAKSGYFVPRLTPEDLEEALEVRIMLETGAIERICRLRRNLARHLKPLRDSCRRFEQLIGDSFLLGAAEADQRFHDALIERAGSRRLSIVYHRARLLVAQPGVFDRKEWLATASQLVEEHRAILSAIQESRPEEAQRLLRAHLTDHRLSTLGVV